MGYVTQPDQGSDASWVKDPYVERDFIVRKGPFDSPLRCDSPLRLWLSNDPQTMAALRRRGTSCSGPRPSLPSRNLQDGQGVTVAVRGLPDGIKYSIFECPTPTDANHAGCGPQLAQQPFGVTGNSGTGTAPFTVHLKTAAAANNEVLEPCAGECVVMVAPDLPGAFSMVSPITFASTG